MSSSRSLSEACGPGRSPRACPVPAVAGGVRGPDRDADLGPDGEPELGGRVAGDPRRGCVRVILCDGAPPPEPVPGGPVPGGAGVRDGGVVMGGQPGRGPGGVRHAAGAGPPAVGVGPPPGGVRGGAEGAETVPGVGGLGVEVDAPPVDAAEQPEAAGAQDGPDGAVGLPGRPRRRRDLENVTWGSLPYWWLCLERVFSPAGPAVRAAGPFFRVSGGRVPGLAIDRIEAGVSAVDFQGGVVVGECRLFLARELADVPLRAVNADHRPPSAMPGNPVHALVPG